MCGTYRSRSLSPPADFHSCKRWCNTSRSNEIDQLISVLLSSSRIINVVPRISPASWGHSSFAHPRLIRSRDTCNLDPINQWYGRIYTEKIVHMFWNTEIPFFQRYYCSIQILPDIYVHHYDEEWLFYTTVQSYSPLLVLETSRGGYSNNRHIYGEEMIVSLYCQSVSASLSGLSISDHTVYDRTSNSKKERKKDANTIFSM